jgi:multidrug efflux pump subunit AcrA (membrane-fusion protein)
MYEMKNMKTGRRLMRMAVSLAVLFAVSCGKARSPQPADSSAPEVRAIQVSIVAAQVREVPVSIEANGTFEASEASDLTPPAEGTVISTPVDIGASVESGDVVVRLDDRDARLRLDQARAMVEQAEASLRQAEFRVGLMAGGTFDPLKVPEVQASQAAYESAKSRNTLAQADAARYAELFRTGDVSRSSYEKYKSEADSAKSQAEAAKQQYEAALNTARQGFQGVGTAQASLASARAQLAIAQKAVDDTIVRAPFAGQITARLVAVGEYVSKSSKLLTIVRSNPMKLQLQMPEANASRIRPGQRVIARVAAFPALEFVGEIRAINPAISVESRALTVEVRFQNPDLKLQPGMFATSNVQLAGTEKAVFVPQDAIASNPGLESAQVFLVDGGVAHARVVLPGSTTQGMVRVLSGLSGGETLAVTNLDNLYDGVAVRQ